uniref:Large ribosomal subunit protein uL18c n=1 Tax=Neotessella volvocina TaxID=52559 RepID=A0A3G2R013_9STRA|nr:ribosomal protein L18 [Neotessella volvocina]
MKKKIKKIYLQQKKRYLKKIVGTNEKPRLSVFRSHKHIYAQLIDDKEGKTLAFSSTLNKEILELVDSTATQKAAEIVGEKLAEKALKKNIQFAVFDRGIRPYHGRIKNVAEGARKNGLLF